MQSISLEAPTRQRRQDRSAASSSFRLIAAALCVLTALSFFFLPLPTFQWFSDYWEHASAVRVLSESVVHPTNPHYATYDPDRQFIPLFALLGLLMKATGMAVTTALALGAVLTTVLFCIGVNMFATAYYRHRWAPTVLMAVLLCGWGTPWVWVGFYELRALFYNGFYPATFVLSLTFITWAVVVRALREDALRVVHCWLLPVLAALMFVSHQLGGLFAMGGIVLFLLCEPKTSINTRVGIFLLLAAGLAVTWWWPYFNPIKLTIVGSGDKENDGVPDFYNLVKVVLLIGPAWLGVPVLIGMLRKRVQLALVAGFAALFSVYLFGGMVGHPVAHRFLSYSVLYLHLAIVWKLLAMLPDQGGWPGRAHLRPGRPGGAIWLLVALCVVLQTGFAAMDFARIAYERTTGKSFGKFPNYPVVAELMAVTGKLPDNAILFATVDPALCVKAFKGKVVARPRPQLMIADGAARNQDNARFFALATPQAERRELIRKYGATHILIRKENVAKQVTQDLQALGETVPTTGSLVLVKVDSAAPR
jgi:hypothetical protein